MYPQLIQIRSASGLIQVNSYPFFLFISCIFMIAGTLLQCRRLHITPWDSLRICVGMIFAATVGARIFHILTHISLYQKNLTLVFLVDTHGLSLFGSIILVCCGGILIGQKSHFPIWKFSDGLVPFLGIGIAIARIGCFLNGCCSGKVSDLPWAVRFPLFSEAHLYQMSRGQTNLITVLPVHPTQLYEAAGMLVSLFVAKWVSKKKNFDGAGILVFLASFSVVRLIMHYLRVFPDSFLWIEPVFPTVYIAVLFVCLKIYKTKNNQNKRMNFMGQLMKVKDRN